MYQIKDEKRSIFFYGFIKHFLWFKATNISFKLLIKIIRIFSQIRPSFLLSRVWYYEYFSWRLALCWIFHLNFVTQTRCEIISLIFTWNFRSHFIIACSNFRSLWVYFSLLVAYKGLLDFIRPFLCQRFNRQFDIATL